MGFDVKRKPKYARWDYRMLSHELNNDLPTSYLKIIFDPVSGRRHDWNRKTYEDSATAKFDIEGLDYHGSRKEPGHERPIYYNYLDSLMEEIPGKDNYGASITADGFDTVIKSAHPKRKGATLNGAHYHRPYKLTSKDAMGVDMAQRGYSDRFYLALTTQDNVAGVSYVITNKKGETIKNVHAKASYAVPVEIIYLTPLNKWNPFNIKQELDCSDVTGIGTKADPFSASCPDRHFLTPDSFFTGSEATVCSNDSNIMYFDSPLFDDPVCLRPSGIHIVLPRINGIDGIIRQRYPIMPINGEGSSVWKTLNAMEDSVNLSGEVVPKRVTYETGESTLAGIPTHKHTIVISKEQQKTLLEDATKAITKATEADNKHTHILTLKRDSSSNRIIIKNCDSGAADGFVCFDKHHNFVVEVR